jgi:hypothetical protein
MVLALNYFLIFKFNFVSKKLSPNILTWEMHGNIVSSLEDLFWLSIFRKHIGKNMIFIKVKYFFNLTLIKITNWGSVIRLRWF